MTIILSADISSFFLIQKVIYFNAHCNINWVHVEFTENVQEFENGIIINVHLTQL